MDKDYEKLAEDFLVTLTWNAENRSIEILKENPEILNTKKMATTISPDVTERTPSPDSYNLAFRVVDALCKYRDEGIISEEQFNRTINTPSPTIGETLLTSVLKNTLKAAQTVEKSKDSFWRSAALKDMDGFSSRLRDLIDQNGKIRVDVNIPNLRGQYPLELMQTMSSGTHLHDYLPTEHNCIMMATNPAIEAKIKYGMTGKSEIEQVDDSAQLQTKALLIDSRVDPNDPKNAMYSNYNEPSDVSVLKINKPTFLASDIEDPLSIARIHDAGEYILRHYKYSKPAVYNINQLNEYHCQRLYLKHNDKWNEVPQDKIYDTVKALTNRSHTEKVR